MKRLKKCSLINPSYYKFLPGLLLIFSAPSFYSQTQEASSYKAFDDVIALENTGLSNGVEYVEQHIIRNDRHKYFLSSNFLKGDVHYDGQPYYDVSLKYNVYDDVLLLLLQNSNGVFTFMLHKKKVRSFAIGGHNFIRVPEKEGFKAQGYYEVLLELEEIVLLKKHVKKISKHLDKNFTYYEFVNDDVQHYIFFESSYYPVNSRRDVQKIFPEHEKQIKRYYRNNKRLRKDNADLFISNLLQSLNPQL